MTPGSAEQRHGSTTRLSAYGWCTASRFVSLTGLWIGLACCFPLHASDEVEGLIQWRSLGALPAWEAPPAPPDQSASLPPSPPPPAPVPPKTGFERPNPCKHDKQEEELVGETARVLQETLCGASLWFDGLFGERNVDAARKAHGRLEFTMSQSQYYGFKQRSRLDVRVELPNLENRAVAFIGRDNDDEYVRDRREGFALRSQFPSIDDRDEWLAGLGYSLPGNRNLGSDFRVGIRNLRDPRVFVQNRVTYNAYADEVSLLHLRATPFYNSRDGFGITPGIDYSYVLSETRLLRWSNIGTVSRKNRGFDWRSALIHYQSVGDGRGVAVEGFLRGATAGIVELREYGGRLIYRHPLSRNRLFLELVTGYTWPRERRDEERHGSYLFAAGLELPFGHEH